MAHLRKEGMVVYPASGRVLILGVCGMEKKVENVYSYNVVIQGEGLYELPHALGAPAAILLKLILI